MLRNPTSPRAIRSIWALARSIRETCAGSACRGKRSLIRAPISRPPALFSPAITSRSGPDARRRNGFKALHDAGVRLAFGTDSGPPGRFQGYFEQLELEELVTSGLTPSQALLTATRDAAQCLGLADRAGTLEPGRYADFIVLSRNPLDDIRHTRAIESVWIAGNRVARP